MPKKNEPQPKYCRKCRVPLKDGKCPQCGFKAYEPMSEKKIWAIRLTLGGIVLAGFILWLVLKK